MNFSITLADWLEAKCSLEGKVLLTEQLDAMKVYSHGGDVMRFAGDSVICAFLPSAEEAAAGDGGLAAATLRSVRCAATLAQDLGAALTCKI